LNDLKNSVYDLPIHHGFKATATTTGKRTMMGISEKSKAIKKETVRSGKSIPPPKTVEKKSKVYKRHLRGKTLDLTKMGVIKSKTPAPPILPSHKN
jgi:hypothetical protein